MNNFFLPFRLAFMLLLLALGSSSCSQEKAEPVAPAASHKLYLAATNTSQANVTNKLLAYTTLGSVTHYSYGNFNQDGTPGTLRESIIADARTGRALTAIYDDSMRVRTLYVSNNGIKDTLFYSFSYPNPTLAVLSVHRINWATDFTKLVHRVVLAKSGERYTVVSDMAYSSLRAGASGVASQQQRGASGGSAAPDDHSSIMMLQGPVATPSPTAGPWVALLTAQGTDKGGGNPQMKTTDSVTDFITLVSTGVAAIGVANVIIVAAGITIGILAAPALGITAVAGAGYGWGVGVFLAVMGTGTAGASTLTPDDRFTTPPANTPPSPTTQIQNTPLGRFKIYTGIGTQQASVPVPALGSCCASVFTYHDCLIEVKLATNGASAGRFKSSAFRRDCDGGQSPINGNTMQMTTATASGNNVSLRFTGGGNATFQGALNSRGGSGTLSVNTSAYCPAQPTAGSNPTSYSVPMRMEAVN